MGAYRQRSVRKSPPVVLPVPRQRLLLDRLHQLGDDARASPHPRAHNRPPFQADGISGPARIARPLGASTSLTSQPVIHAAAIRKTYGETVAVDDVSFEVHAGEIFG